MNYSKKIFWLLVQIVVVQPWASANAYAQTYSVTVLGDGLASCGTWTNDRKQNLSDGDEEWVEGFITSEELDVTRQFKENVTINTDTGGIFGWLDNYCQANPTVNLGVATVAFLAESNTLTYTK